MLNEAGRRSKNVCVMLYYSGRGSDSTGMLEYLSARPVEVNCGTDGVRTQLSRISRDLRKRMEKTVG